MIRVAALLSLVLAGSLLAAPACLAQEVEGDEVDGAERARHRHGISLFVGAATHTDPGETGGAVGLGYAYRISHRWALGAKVEFISSSLERDWVVLASAGFEAAEHLEFGFESAWKRRPDPSSRTTS
jgi:hypothetical protein